MAGLGHSIDGLKLWLDYIYILTDLGDIEFCLKLWLKYIHN